MDIGSIGHNTQKVSLLCAMSNAAYVHGLSPFCVLCPMLPMSMDCLPSVWYVQCCLCQWIVSLLCVMSNAAYVNGLSPFCVLCPMLPWT
jgi:hypothetical protein